MRLSDLRLTPATRIAIDLDGEPLEALEGETIAAAMAAAGRNVYRRTRGGRPRGLYCGMGTCFDCAVTVDGRMGQRACLTKVADGMRVATAMPAAGELADLAQQSASTEHSVDCLVVGAGPAGLTCAAAVAEAGASVLVVDERQQPGGQYFKPLASSHRAPGDAATDHQFAAGRALVVRAQRAGVMLWPETTVFAAYGVHEIGVLRAGTATTIRAGAVVLAAGAYERAVPVPGWTLPGVMTTGALQTLVRAYRVSPSDRIVIAGNGPLNFQLAIEQMSAGVKPLAVVEAAPRPSLARLRDLARMAVASSELTGQGLNYLWRLRRAGVPVLWGGSVVACEGEDAVARVIVAHGDRRRVLEADTVALGYGFVPQTDLARLIGCAVDYDASGLGALTVVADADGATSLPGVFAIGDGARIGGARVALAAGTVTAGAVCGLLGKPMAAGRIASARDALDRARAFQSALWRLFAAPDVATAAIADDTLVCRCEEVSAGAVRAACRTHDASATAVKRLTRAGMGRCQGRYCAATIARLVEDAGGPAAHPRGFFAPRAPVRPVPLAALAAEQTEWGGHREVVPPALSPRPLRQNSFADITTDVCVIGGGIAGVCVARELSTRGLGVTVVDRQEPNAQASGANAGSLHVQLLSYDFGAKAQAGGQPALETLRIAPAAIALWRQLEALTKQDLEVRVTGGLMVAENDTELAFLRAKAAVERDYGVVTEIIGGNELRTLEPHLAARLIGAAHCASEGKINPLTATFAVRRLAREAGARFEGFATVTAIERTSGGFLVETEAGRVRARRVVNCAGGWASRIAAMVDRPIPVHGAPLQMIVTEPAPALVSRLIAHASRHLSLKQADAGGLIIGGGWPAALDAATGASRPERASIAGNSFVACRVLPPAAGLHVLRVWAGMNINIDGAPIVGEMPGVPGFFNCVTSSGYTLAPAVARITADLIARGASDLPYRAFTLDRF